MLLEWLPCSSQVGTLTYMAPEVLVNRDGKYDGKVGHTLLLGCL